MVGKHVIICHKRYDVRANYSYHIVQHHLVNFVPIFQSMSAGWVNRGRFTGKNGAAVKEGADAALDIAVSFFTKHLLLD